MYLIELIVFYYILFRRLGLFFVAFDLFGFFSTMKQEMHFTLLCDVPFKRLRVRPQKIATIMLYYFIFLSLFIMKLKC